MLIITERISITDNWHMFENFEKIPEEKKKIIIEAGLEEFAAKGYERASTNNIINKAGIPKGTLFYYFGSKKDLYFYILDYAVKEIAKEFKLKASGLSTDFFERLLQRGMIKLEIAIKKPLLFEILSDSALNIPDNMKQEVREKYTGFYKENESGLYKGIDSSKFNDGIDVKKAVEIITIFLEGMLSRYMNEFRKSSPSDALDMYEKISSETREYFEILKKGIYKPAETDGPD